MGTEAMDSNKRDVTADVEAAAFAAARVQGLRAERAYLSNYIAELDRQISEIHAWATSAIGDLAQPAASQADPEPPPTPVVKELPRRPPARGAVTRGRPRKQPRASQQISYGRETRQASMWDPSASHPPLAPADPVPVAVTEAPPTPGKPGRPGRLSSAAAYERRMSEEAIARHHAQVEADRARAATQTAPSTPPETRSRFSQRTWEEAELVNPRRLQASEPPIPEHLRQELQANLPADHAGRPFGIDAPQRRVRRFGKAGV